MATVRSPSSLAARRIRMEISPRLSASSLRIYALACGGSPNGGDNMGAPGTCTNFFCDARSYQSAGIVRVRFVFGYCRAPPPLLFDRVRHKLHGHRRLSLNSEREL